MRFTLFSFALAFSCAASVLADGGDTTTEEYCLPYVFNDETQATFNEGNDYWIPFDDLPVEINTDTLVRHVPDTQISVPCGQASINPDEYRYDNYTVCARYNNKGGEYDMKMSIGGDHGLSRTLLVGFKDSNGKFLAMNFLWPLEWCSYPQNFNAADVAEVQIFASANL